jgi:hypothetical protein
MNSLDEYINKKISSIVHKDDDPLKNNQYYSVSIDTKSKLRK